MGKGIFQGVSGVARKTKETNIGVSGVARKVKNGYIGDSSGVARQFYIGEYKTLKEAFDAGAWWRCVAVTEYEKVVGGEDEFTDTARTHTFKASSDNTLIHQSQISYATHTGTVNSLKYYKYMYFFCSTLEGATEVATLISNNFTTVKGVDTDGYSYGTKTITSVYNYEQTCADIQLVIEYFRTKHWEVYKSENFVDKYVVRVGISSSFLSSWNADGDYPSGLDEIIFS